MIYEVDAKWRKVRDGLLWYDATLKNAGAVFEILAAHLINLGAQEAAEWIFISDGAEWIWDRVTESAC